jgi:folate-binding protein YgfZ
MFSHDQYRAATERAALIDRTSRGTISLVGADRASFLHGLLTNDIARLTPGTGTYAAYLTPQGRMISDMRVVECGGELLLDVEASLADALSARLNSLIFSEDVQVTNVTATVAQLRVCGPASAAVLEQALGVPAARLESLHEYDNLRPAASALTIVRDDGLGVPGYDLCLSLAPTVSGVDRISPPVRLKQDTTDAVLRAGAAPAGEETAEVLRIEAGRPRFTVDMDTDTIPLEAGIEQRAISFTKGCYVGQEVIIRVLHRGHGRVARKLVSLEFAGGVVPVSGDVISADGQDIGRITSAAFSPRRNGPLAIGFVHRDYLAPGTSVTVQRGTDPLEAFVRQLGQ